MRTLIEHLNVAFLVDAKDTILRDASIVVDDDRLADLGPAGEVAARHGKSKFDRVIDGRMLAICPGFIDSHVHLSETLSRAVFPDNLNTRAWVFHWAKPFYAHITEEDEYWGALLGMTEMLRAGTTCFLDMGSQYDPGDCRQSRGEDRHARRHRPSCRRQSAAPSCRAGWTQEMVHHHFFKDAKTALEELEECVRKYNGALDGRMRCWVNIEGKEPCTLELHVGAVQLAEKLGVGTTYHLATSIEEAKVCEQKHGVWPVTRIERAGGLRSNLVIAHCAAVQDAEVAIIGRARRQGGVLPVFVVQARQGRDRDRQISGNGRGRRQRGPGNGRGFGGGQHESDAANAARRRDVQGCTAEAGCVHRAPGLACGDDRRRQDA